MITAIIYTLIIIASLFIILLIVFNIAILISNNQTPMDPISYESATLPYWPTQEWKVSTPEEQGMHSTKLLEMVDYYEEKHSTNENNIIDSITILRNGYIVTDIYLNSLFPNNAKHVIQSCTKSIMSALIGIAIEEGYIEDVDMHVLDILYDTSVKNADPMIRELTIKDLLTMQTGIHSRDSYLYEWEGLFEMQKTENWTEYILNLPMETRPGTRFDYSNMASFLLSAIIKASTERNTLDFANEHLFEPLGIQDVKWEKSPQGIDIGWARMWLHPHDMAKIGLLYLQKGNWDDKQIIPSKWIEESLKPHSLPKKYRYVYNKEGNVDYIKSGGLWMFTNIARPFADGYGYQWWLDKDGMFTALGHGGQFIVIAPKENLVAVFTSKLSGSDSFLPIKLLNKFILPSIEKKGPITANQLAHNKLSKLSNPPHIEKNPTPVQNLPDAAYDISGEVYSLEPNPWMYDNFQLVFHDDSDHAEFSYSYKKNEEINFRIGLDGIHRFTEHNGDTYAALGSWTTPDQFTLQYERIGYSARNKWTFTFNGKEISVKESGVTGVYSYIGKKRPD